jgi:hypothetical protein
VQTLPDGACPPSADPLRSNDLMTLLPPPPGYVPIPGDSISGPIVCDTVPVLFSDHPEDARTVLANGFVAGAVVFWQDEPPADPTTHELVTLGVILVELDTPEHAEAVLSHFRTVNASDPYEFFDVPAGLTDGYGVHSAEPDSFGTVFYGIAWRHGSSVVNVSYSSSAPERDTGPVTQVALAVEADLP